MRTFDTFLRDIFVKLLQRCRYITGLFALEKYFENELLYRSASGSGQEVLSASGGFPVQSLRKGQLWKKAGGGG